MIRLGQILTSLALCSALAAAAPKPLETFKGCTLVPTDWADGDSFRIKTSKGMEMTIRLYAVDCLETGNLDDTDSRRLRAQRRYFGITDEKGNHANPIEMAKALGKQASDKTAALLGAPFTVHTRMSKALGDGIHERFYGFVETEDGKDLATELVRAGLARAYGVSADGPGGRSRERYKEILADIELQSAKRGIGIWAVTNWDKLPNEREVQRTEDEEDQIAKGNHPLPVEFRLNPNTASRDDLVRLPKIGEALADRIMEARDDAPFKKPEDLMRVLGIKKKTLEGIRQYLNFAAP